MTYHFTVRLAGDPEHDDALADRLFEAGCDDGSLWSEGAATFVTFHREAATLDAAISAAAADLAAAGQRMAGVTLDPETVGALIPAAAA